MQGCAKGAALVFIVARPVIPNASWSTSQETQDESLSSHPVVRVITRQWPLAFGPTTRLTIGVRFLVTPEPRFGLIAVLLAGLDWTLPPFVAPTVIPSPVAALVVNPIPGGVTKDGGTCVSPADSV